MKRKEAKKDKDTSVKGPNIFVVTVVVIIIITFIFGGVLNAYTDFLKYVGKKKVKNPDGTISIEADAQSPENKNDERGKYIGMVLGEKIVRGRYDDFNLALYNIAIDKNMNPYQKYEEAKNAFNDAINRIIGTHVATKLGINITSESNYYIKEVAKKGQYVDFNGKINYEKMKEEQANVNKIGKEIKKKLIYNIFVRDVFEGLPISYDEMWDSYKMYETKLSVKYYNISNRDVTEEEVKNYFEKNKENFKKYKLIKIYFIKQKDAEIALEDLKSGTEKIDDFITRVESEESAKVNRASDFSFINELESDELKEAVPDTKKNSAGDKIIETELGPMIYYVSDIEYGNYEDAQDKYKIRSIYIEKNKEALDKKSRKKAEEIYDFAANKSFDDVESKYSLEKKSSAGYLIFMENSYYNPAELNFDYDNTSDTTDVDFMVSLFKSDINSILKPKKHDNGYIVVMVDEKINASKEKFDGLYDSLIDRYKSFKSSNLQDDFYKEERKKYTIVDNFKYCIKIEDFVPQQQ